MARWFLKPVDEGGVDALARELALPRVLARLLALRGYDTPVVARRFLDARTSLSWLDSPPTSPAMERAVARLKAAMAHHEPMVIYGDYDCDGVTSTTVLYRYLRKAGANVQAFLPHREKDGYGVTAAAVERLADQGAKLILTCDNGIAAVAAAHTARARGVDLIVTDHHQVPEELPDAHTLIHPALDWPHLKDLAGVGVAFLLTLALEGARSARMDYMLDFVAIGTVADVVPLDGPNRAIVHQGLARLRERGGSVFPGITELGKVAKVNWAELSARDLGFAFGPRLNAAGRLEDPTVGFQLLSTNDPKEAEALARRLESINQERRARNLELEAEVVAQVEARWDLGAEPFLVLADPSFHPGIIGIVAGKLKERYRVPVLLLAGQEGGLYKGSGRSPEGLHLYEALHAARAHLLGFGGHAQAAGCATTEDQLPALRMALNAHLADRGWSRPPDTVALDALLPFQAITPELMSALERLEPHGQKNPEPVFGLLGARVVRVQCSGRHAFLTLDDGQDVRELKAWGMADQAGTWQGRMNVTYRLRPSTRNPGTLDLVVDRIEPAPEEAPVELVSASARLSDRRDEDALPPPGALVLGATIPPGMQAYDPAAPGRAREVWVVGPPADEATWLQARMRAEALVLVAGDSRTEGGTLEVEELTELYRKLLGLRVLPLEEAVRLSGMDGYRATEALRIFREAGIMVVREREWKLLRAPDVTIPLRTLESYRRHLEAIAFRRAWPILELEPV